MGFLDGGGGGGGSSSYNASCGRIIGLAWNLSSSYTDQSKEAPMVSASIIMFLLAALFFNLNLFSGLSDVSAILDPKVRFLLSKALSFFLPVMSYLFSEAKNAGLVCSTPSGSVSVAGPDELSLRAGLILTWMLVVELLRKKVEEIRMQGWNTGTVERAGRVVWLGSLVFFNLRGAGRKAVFGILWLLCAAKLVQRITFTEVGKRSLAYGKNARLIISYMAQMLEQDQYHDQEQQCGDELLKRCKYVVMGEEMLVTEVCSDGYKLAGDGSTVVTVGQIWDLAERDPLFTSVDQDRRLRRLCLSFALFKLLRRCFEHLPAMTEAETRHCRDLIFKGLYNEGGEAQADAVFQVMNDEANFLSEYYHSVVPVVLASPFFLLANYILLPLVVTVLCFVVVVLCGNGDVAFALHSLKGDNYAISLGVTKMARCLLSIVTRSPSVFFTTVDFSITLLLFLILVYEEVWEFVVFLLSNWFVVSLLHEYTAKSEWGSSLSWAIRRILWVRSKMSHPELSFKQFSLLTSCRFTGTLGLPTVLPLLLQSKPVPSGAKHSIMEHLVALGHGSADADGESRLPWACGSDSFTGVVLTWHITTTVLEVKWPPPQSQEEASASMAAASLSKYCAYLVAFHPELLPDNPDKTEQVFEAVKEELKCKLGGWEYYFWRLRSRVDKIMETTGWKERKATKAAWNGSPTLETMLMDEAAQGGSAAAWQLMTDGLKEKEVVWNGATLAAMLMDQEGPNVWNVLADVWTELMVSVALSSDEERVMGHKKALPEGGEFVTVLWALTTHTGISRPAATPVHGRV